MTSEKDILITVTDKNFIQGTQIMLYSFLTHNKWYNGDILILSDEDIEGLLEHEIRFAGHFKFKKIDKELLEKIETLKNKNIDYVKNEKAFYCLEVFNFLNYKNIICVDSDILFRGSIKEWIDAGHTFSAVGDKPYYKDLTRKKNDFSSRIKKENISLSERWNDSLNAGIFVTKTDALAKDMYHQLLSYISVEIFDKFKGKQQDQFIIFLYFKDIIKFVSSKFNYRFQLEKEMKEKDGVSFKDAHVIHFTGPHKPWNSIFSLLPKLRHPNFTRAYLNVKFIQFRLWIRNKQLKRQENIHYKKIKALSQQKMMPFDNVHTFCLFVGYPRSGHTLIGALLDAHPNMAIATELDIFDLYEKGFSKSQISSLIAERSREMRENKYMWTDYSYKVPNQFQGSLEKSLVMGVKHGGKLSNILRKDFDYISKFNNFAERLKLIHIIRNPYDMITTRVTRREKNIQKKLSQKGILEVIDTLFYQINITAQLKETNQYDIFDLTNENFIDDPSFHLKRLCDFLDLECTEDYLKDCASIVFKKPTQTRFKVDWWDKKLKEMVQNEMNKYDHFSHYSFEVS